MVHAEVRGVTRIAHRAPRQLVTKRSFRRRVLDAGRMLLRPYLVLELRPSCEHCKKLLPAHSTEARICSFECTFCSACVEQVLQGVCPNCGGNFCPRPIRPARDWNGENFLGKYPAGTRVVERALDGGRHAQLVEQVQHLDPTQR